MEQRSGGESKRVSLCAACAQKQGLSTAGGQLTLNLATLMAAMPSGSSPVEGLVCPSCGMTSEQFREVGRLGCARCYEAFDDLLRPIVRRTQAGTAHRGLAPRRLAAAPEPNDLEALKGQLKQAVKEERYEEAARLRDRIRENSKAEA